MFVFLFNKGATLITVLNHDYFEEKYYLSAKEVPNNPKAAQSNRNGRLAAVYLLCRVPHVQAPSRSLPSWTDDMREAVLSQALLLMLFLTHVSLKAPGFR